MKFVLALALLCALLTPAFGQVTGVTSYPTPYHGLTATQSATSLGVWFTSPFTTGAGADQIVVSFDEAVFAGGPLTETVSVNLGSGFTGCTGMGSIDATNMMFTLALFDDVSSSMTCSVTGSAAFWITSDLSTSATVGNLVTPTVTVEGDSAVAGTGWTIGDGQITVQDFFVQDTNQNNHPGDMTLTFTYVNALSGGDSITITADSAYFNDQYMDYQSQSNISVALNTGFTNCDANVTMLSSTQIAITVFDKIGQTCSTGDATMNMLSITVSDSTPHSVMFFDNGATPHSFYFFTSTDVAYTNSMAYWTEGSERVTSTIFDIGNPRSDFIGGASTMSPPEFYYISITAGTTIAETIYMEMDTTLFDNGLVENYNSWSNEVGCFPEMIASDNSDGLAGAMLTVTLRGTCTPTATPFFYIENTKSWSANAFNVVLSVWTATTYTDALVDFIEITDMDYIESDSTSSISTWGDMVKLNVTFAQNLGQGDTIYLYSKGATVTFGSSTCTDHYNAGTFWLDASSSLDVTVFGQPSCNQIASSSVATDCPGRAIHSIALADASCSITAGTTVTLDIDTSGTGTPTWDNNAYWTVASQTQAGVWTRESNVHKITGPDIGTPNNMGDVVVTNDQAGKDPQGWSFDIDFNTAFTPTALTAPLVLTIASDQEWYELNDYPRALMTGSGVDTMTNCQIGTINTQTNMASPYPYALNIFLQDGTGTTCDISVVPTTETLDITTADLASVTAGAISWLPLVENQVYNFAVLTDSGSWGTPFSFTPTSSTQILWARTDDLVSANSFTLSWYTGVSFADADTLTIEFGAAIVNAASNPVATHPFAQYACSLSCVESNTQQDIVCTFNDDGGTCNVPANDVYWISFDTTEITWADATYSIAVADSTFTSDPYSFTQNSGGTSTDPIVNKITCIDCHSAPEWIFDFQSVLNVDAQAEYNQVFTIASDYKVWSTDASVDIEIVMDDFTTASATATASNWGRQLDITIYNPDPTEWSGNTLTNFTLKTTSNQEVFMGSLPNFYLFQSASNMMASKSMAASSIHDLTVTPTTTVATAAVDYTFAFTTHSALMSGDTISIMASNGVFNSITSVTVDNMWCNATTVNEVDTMNIVVTVAGWNTTGCMYAAHGAITVTLTGNAGMNPASNTETEFTVWTSNDDGRYEMDSYETDATATAVSTDVGSPIVGDAGTVSVRFSIDDEVEPSDSFMVNIPGFGAFVDTANTMVQIVGGDYVDGISASVSSDDVTITNGAYLQIPSGSTIDVMVAYTALAVSTANAPITVSSGSNPPFASVTVGSAFNISYGVVSNVATNLGNAVAQIGQTIGGDVNLQFMDTAPINIGDMITIVAPGMGEAISTGASVPVSLNNGATGTATYTAATSTIVITTATATIPANSLVSINITLGAGLVGTGVTTVMTGPQYFSVMTSNSPNAVMSSTWDYTLRGAMSNVMVSSLTSDVIGAAPDATITVTFDSDGPVNNGDTIQITLPGFGAGIGSTPTITGTVSATGAWNSATNVLTLSATAAAAEGSHTVNIDTSSGSGAIGDGNTEVGYKNAQIDASYLDADTGAWSYSLSASYSNIALTTPTPVATVYVGGSELAVASLTWTFQTSGALPAGHNITAQFPGAGSTGLDGTMSCTVGGTTARKVMFDNVDTLHITVAGVVPGATTHSIVCDNSGAGVWGNAVIGSQMITMDGDFISAAGMSPYAYTVSGSFTALTDAWTTLDVGSTSGSITFTFVSDAIVPLHDTIWIHTQLADADFSSASFAHANHFRFSAGVLEFNTTSQLSASTSYAVTVNFGQISTATGENDNTSAQIQSDSNPDLFTSTSGAARFNSLTGLVITNSTFVFDQTSMTPSASTKESVLTITLTHGVSAIAWEIDGSNALSGTGYVSTITCGSNTLTLATSDASYTYTISMTRHCLEGTVTMSVDRHTGSGYTHNGMISWSGGLTLDTSSVSIADFDLTVGGAVTSVDTSSSSTTYFTFTTTGTSDFNVGWTGANIHAQELDQTSSQIASQGGVGSTVYYLDGGNNYVYATYYTGDTGCTTGTGVTTAVSHAIDYSCMSYPGSSTMYARWKCNEVEDSSMAVSASGNYTGVTGNHFSTSACAETSNGQATFSFNKGSQDVCLTNSDDGEIAVTDSLHAYCTKSGPSSPAAGLMSGYAAFTTALVTVFISIFLARN